jgi:hypothetical protein
MAINATTKGTAKELIPAGNYVARCYQMLQIGTVTEDVNGETKTQHKVRIGWELPTELKVFDSAKGEQPLVISKEFTLSMHEKSNLRKTLASWRGKDFSADEAKSFDILKLIGAPCMLNIIHKPSKDGTRMYEEIGSISPMPKGVTAPEQINPTIVLEYDNFNQSIFESLPDFIKNKIKSSAEYIAMSTPETKHIETSDDLPF